MMMIAFVCITLMVKSESTEANAQQIFISFFGNTLTLQLIGQILCGIPWGVYQTVTTVYASEVLPLNLRGYLTSYGKSQSTAPTRHTIR